MNQNVVFVYIYTEFVQLLLTIIIMSIGVKGHSSINIQIYIRDYSCRG